MNGKYAIMDILSNNAAVGAFVGSGSGARIYYNEVEQMAQLPVIVIKEDEIIAHDTKDGPSNLDEDLVYVSILGNSETSAGALAKAVRTAIDKVTGTYSGVIVVGIQFRTQRSDTERLTNKPTILIEQLYKIMTIQ